MGTSGNRDCQWASRSVLKDFTEDALTILADSLFQNGATRFVKANLRRRVDTPLLKAYANLLDPSADSLCPLCKEEPQTIEPLLRRCPRLDATRQNIFGSPSPPLKVLTTDPERLLPLARAPSGRPLAL